MNAPGRLKYNGNCVSEVVGRVVGPTTYGSLLVVTVAEFDESIGMTVCTCSPVQDEQRQQISTDSFGQMWLDLPKPVRA